MQIQCLRVFWKIADAAQPIADTLARIVDEQLDKFSGWFDEHQVEIAENLEIAWGWLVKIRDVLIAIEDIQFTVLFKLLDALQHPLKTLEDLAKVLQAVGEPALLPQLPGAPPQMPIPGGAGTQGEAARRAEEGRRKAAEKAAQDQSKGYAPYQRGYQGVSGSVSALDAQLGGVLAGHAKTFEAMGKKYGVDPLLLMAIAKFETGSGTSYSARTRKNIAGIMNPKNPSQHMEYASIEEGIEAQAKLLAKYKRMGLTAIPDIGRRYSPPGAANDPNRTNASWPSNVQKNYDRLERAAKTEPTANISRPAPQGDRQTAGTGERTSSIMESAMMKLPGGPGSSLNRMIKDINTQQRVQGATGGTNIAGGINPNITIHGVPTGKEMVVARATQKAMNNSTNELLAQLKKARSAEARLGYV